MKQHEELYLRARVNACIRQFFSDKNVLEVETPILSQAGNSDPNIASFSVEFSGHVAAGTRQRWLRTSPEFPLKRLLAAGLGDCYELGRVFRNGETGIRHNPEFTMLEWYRLGWGYQQLIDEVVMLVRTVLSLVGRTLHFERVSYGALFQRYLNIDPFTSEIPVLRTALGDINTVSKDLSRDDWLHLLMTHQLLPRLGKDQLIAVYDYPASQCALAKLNGHGHHKIAERFEVYIGQLELANGYHELCDANEQRMRFHDELKVRKQRGLPMPALDEPLLTAMSSGLPACAGVAMGIDRLLMAMLDSDQIADVLAFGFAQA